MTFKEKLLAASKKNSSLLCIGLDSDVDKLPLTLKSGKDPQFTFNKAIIDATHEVVCAYKPNSAFYESSGEEGIRQLKLTCDYLKNKFPEIPVILDAKRADIGSTNFGYAKFVFDYLDADGITVHPYLGKEAMKIFLNRPERGIFVLCRTSNPGAGEFQDLKTDNKPFYQTVAEHVAKDWNYNGNCGLVVGATYPEELSIVRRLVGDMPLLIPGIGAQGGDVETTVKAGVDSAGFNAVINVSRSVIFAGSGEDFAQKAKEEAVSLNGQINAARPISQ